MVYVERAFRKVHANKNRPRLLLDGPDWTIAFNKIIKIHSVEFHQLSPLLAWPVVQPKSSFYILKFIHKDSGYIVEEHIKIVLLLLWVMGCTDIVYRLITWLVAKARLPPALPADVSRSRMFFVHQLFKNRFTMYFWVLMFIWVPASF